MWRAVLEPAGPVASDAERRRARIIAGLSLPLILFAGIETCRADSPSRWFFLAVLLQALAAYGSARTRLVRAAGILLVVAYTTLPYIGIGSAAPTTSSTVEVMFVLLAVLVAGLTLPLRTYVVVASFNEVILLWLVAANPEIPPRSGLEFLALVLMVSLVTGIYAVIQAVNEREIARVEELQALNQRLTETREQLVQAAKLAAVGELAAGVAHELNNPLTAAMASAELLSSKVEALGPGAGHLQPWITRMLEATERCRVICERLLSFARQTGGEREDVALWEVVESTVELLDYPLRKHQAHVTVDLEAPLVVNGVRGQLEQVLTNLVLNACQAGARDIEIRGRRSDGQIRLTVADDGPGIAADAVDRVFQPFFTTKPPGSGTGLGLSVSAGIVREHGGRIEVESSLEEGATFTVILPDVAPVVG